MPEGFGNLPGLAVPHSTFVGMLVTVLCLMSFPTALQAQLTYTTNAKGITITGYTGPNVAVVIPNYINGAPVTSIGDSAFYNHPDLPSVQIPDGVTTIGQSAFSFCGSLTNVTFPTSLTNIGYRAFSACYSLSGINLPNRLADLGSRAFLSCTGLTNMIIPNSVTSVGEWAFHGCSGLTSVTLGSGANTIRWNAFGACTSLTRVEIPNGVTYIEGGAFGDCTGLTNVSLPGSLTYIESLVFNGCTNLATITVAPLNSSYSSVAGVLFDKGQTTLISYPGGRGGDYTIPDTVTSIQHDAFSGCTALTGITFGNRVSTIGWSAFFGCTGLTTVNVPYLITNITGYAFSGCVALTNVTLGVGLLNIEEGALSNCSSLTGIFFNGNAPSLGNLAFSGTTNATAYYLPRATGWKPTFGGIPTKLWSPQIQTSGSDFGLRTGKIGFAINWSDGRVVVVEACSELLNPVWTPIATNSLSLGTVRCNDAGAVLQPRRFFRLRSQ